MAYGYARAGDGLLNEAVVTAAIATLPDPASKADFRSALQAAGLMRSAAFVPKKLPAAIALGDWSRRSALYNPDASISDAAGSGIRVAVPASVMLASSVLAEPVDVRDGSFVVPFRPVSGLASDAATLKVFSLQLHSAGSPAAPTGNYHRQDQFGEGPNSIKQLYTTDSTGRAGRWQAIGFPPSALSAVGSGADLSAITWARLELRNFNSGQIVEIDTPTFQPSALSKAACSFRFDDGHSNIYTTAFPALQAKGWKGMLNFGAMATTRDQPGYLTTAQVTELVQAGWQFMLQAYSSEDDAVINPMTDAQRLNEMQQQIDVAVANGWLQDGEVPLGSYFSGVTHKDITAWPMFRDTQRRTMDFSQQRTATPPILYGESYPPADPHLIRTIDAGTSGFVGAPAAHIDQAIASKGWAIVTFHGDLTNLSEYVDYLAANSDVIDVTTEAALKSRFA